MLGWKKKCKNGSNSSYRAFGFSKLFWDSQFSNSVFPENHNLIFSIFYLKSNRFSKEISRKLPFYHSDYHYHRQELKQKLAAYTFSPSSETDQLLHSFAQHHLACPPFTSIFSSTISSDRLGWAEGAR